MVERPKIDEKQILSGFFHINVPTKALKTAVTFLPLIRLYK
jgi:hypothetical protein